MPVIAADYHLIKAEAVSGGGCGAACFFNWNIYHGKSAAAYMGRIGADWKIVTWAEIDALSRDDLLIVLKKVAADMDTVTCIFAGDNMTSTAMRRTATSSLSTGDILLLLEEYQDEIGIEMYRAGPAFLNRAHPNNQFLVYWTIYPPKSLAMLAKADLDPEVVGEPSATPHEMMEVFNKTVVRHNPYAGTQTLKNEGLNKTLKGNIAKIMPRKLGMGNHKVWSVDDIKKILVPIRKGIRRKVA